MGAGWCSVGKQKACVQQSSDRRTRAGLAAHPAGAAAHARPPPYRALEPQVFLSRDGLQLGATDFAEGRFLLTTSPRRGQSAQSLPV